MLKTFATEKHSSLSVRRISDEEKSFVTLTPAHSLIIYNIDKCYRQTIFNEKQFYYYCFYNNNKSNSEIVPQKDLTTVVSDRINFL
jgi:hypothetical protein